MTKQVDVKKGEHVEWKWGSGKAEGDVTAVHTDDVERTIKGSKVKRKASEDRPAVEIKTDKGGRVLKSVSEVKVK